MTISFCSSSRIVATFHVIGKLNFEQAISGTQFSSRELRRNSFTIAIKNSRQSSLKIFSLPTFVSITQHRLIFNEAQHLEPFDSASNKLSELDWREQKRKKKSVKVNDLRQEQKVFSALSTRSKKFASN